MVLCDTIVQFLLQIMTIGIIKLMLIHRQRDRARIIGGGGQSSEDIVRIHTEDGEGRERKTEHF